MQPRLTVGILVLQAEQEGAQQKSGTVKITRNLLLLRAILLMAMMGFVEMLIDKNGACCWYATCMSNKYVIQVAAYLWGCWVLIQPALTLNDMDMHKLIYLTLILNLINYLY